MGETRAIDRHADTPLAVANLCAEMRFLSHECRRVIPLNPLPGSTFWLGQEFNLREDRLFSAALAVFIGNA
jgi:hypothetical protein